ncbi:hypothetical protein SAMN04489761_4598 [Tenacibaculum sp. MAR_2009_124]|uniref:hypothetical protein n=1 Tax=Tenacibaculum sp. MAR_2009_124 TaxID=1250059 RepID=UPI0008962EFF|nr:hypothetical protein [Tenacibaculum sp. MAR_2009_124]SED20049.1 hypothetical protein SAMN04489761_4598 [Tenacibaculum sp. MAR_2009_124]
MKKSTQLILTLTLSLFIFSCSSSEIEDPDVTPVDPPAEKTTYDKDVKTLINNSCATSACHDANAPQAGLPLTNYTQVKNAAENGNLITRINSSSNPMPPTGQNNTVISIIDQWKNDGYLEN